MGFKILINKIMIIVGFLLNSRYQPANTKHAIAKPENNPLANEWLKIDIPAKVIKGEHTNKNLKTKISSKYLNSKKTVSKIIIIGIKRINNNNPDVIGSLIENPRLTAIAFCKNTIVYAPIT